MKKIWKKISYLGISVEEKGLRMRTNVLTNQINFIMMAVMIFLVVIILINAHFIGHAITIGTYRLLILAGINIIIALLAKNKFFMVSKILLIFIPGLSLLIVPAFFGFVEIQSFFYYPIIIIGLSLLPQILFIPKEDKLIFWFSFIYYLTLSYFIYDIMVYFSPYRFDIIDVISDFSLYYKIVPLFVYIFTQVALFYLRNLNVNYEKVLIKSNRELNSTIDELKLTQQHLVQSEKMVSLGTLTSGVVHEINNPLNFIAGGIAVMNNIQKEVLSDKGEEISERYKFAIESIEEGLTRATKIVKGLTSFSYSSKPVLVKSNINEIIENTLLFLNAKIPDNVKITRKYGLRKKVPIYQDKVQQVILNIVDNALYETNKSKKEKFINLSTSSDDKYAIIKIANSGSHIPEDQLNNIFDPFYTTKDPGQGTGLGLSISYSNISDHDGQISVVNTSSGVEFKIKLLLK